MLGAVRVMLGQVWVMLGQVRVMLGQVGSCWDRSESCLCVTTFWPVPYCDFDHVRVMLSTCFALFLIVILIMSQHDFDLDLSTCVSLRKLTQA